jgi:hypothetical protein
MFAGMCAVAVRAATGKGIMAAAQVTAVAELFRVEHARHAKKENTKQYRHNLLG